jgi:hypothetical protein
MDLLLEGILMAIMIAIILIFLVYEASAFFAPPSSIDDFNTFASMTSSACTSIQTSSNMQFSSPELFVFQFYDSNSCNSVLQSNANIFSPTSSALSSLAGNYVMCYANVSNPSALGLSSGDQYYFQEPTSNDINFYLSNNNEISGSGNVSSDQLSENAVQVNSSSSFSITLTAPIKVNPNSYSFNAYSYVNTTSNIEFYFNGLSTCSLSYSDVSGLQKLLLVPPCQENITNITIQVTPAVKGAFYYQTNISAVPTKNPSQEYLSQQCTSLPSLVTDRAIENESIICKPILCGGTSFMLTDQNNRPFLGLYGGSYTFLGVQSGINDLQIVNSHPEQLLNSSLTSQTVFEESGLSAGSSWEVTYDKQTKSSIIGLTGGGSTIAFSVPPGNYSFSIPSTGVIIGHIEHEAYPNESKGYAVQGSFVFIHFSLT